MPCKSRKLLDTSTALEFCAITFRYSYQCRLSSEGLNHAVSPNSLVFMPIICTFLTVAPPADTVPSSAAYTRVTLLTPSIFKYLP